MGRNALVCHRLVKDDLDGGVGVQLGGAGRRVELDDLRRGAEAPGEEDRGCEDREAEGEGTEPERVPTGAQYARDSAFSTSSGTTEPEPLFTSIRAVLSVAILATPVVAVLSAGLVWV